MKKLLLPGSIVLIAAILLFYFFLTIGTNAKANQSGGNSTKTYLLDGSENVQKVNGIVTNIWLDDASQLEKFRQNGIKYLLVDVGAIESIGLTTQTEEIKSFLGFVSNYETRSGYDFILLPYSEVNTDNYEFDANFAKNIITDYANLDALGFDGAFVDIEPVKQTQRDLYIALLEDLRQRMPNAVIAVYSGTVGDSSEWEWNIDFFRKVSKNAGLIVLQGYDLGFTGAEDYVNYLNGQLNAISSEKWNSMFMLAVPTHNTYPETLQNALSAYNTHKSPFIGVAIFSSWTITEEGWKTLERLEK